MDFADTTELPSEFVEVMMDSAEPDADSGRPTQSRPADVPAVDGEALVVHPVD
jgi:hypothetical protein